MTAKPLVGVIGVAEANENERQMAFEVGKLLGAMGLGLVCGGLGGVMQEASRGCQMAGGTVIGILPGGDKEAANDYVTYAIPTNLGHSRNMLIAHAADLLIAIGTGYGTLSEVAIALKLGKKVLSYRSWDVQGVSPCQGLTDIQTALAEFFGDLSTKSLLFKDK
ncbi:MAG: TIGR00725 family protein [Deltaproteobacteria bacterium]|nr:TIGR00725 family protein [Deltaproteobacteria bacterium]